MYNYNWWLVRVSVLLLLPGFFYDIEIIILTISFLILHLRFGLQTIFTDYFHNKLAKASLFILIRLINFEFIRCFIELLI